MQITFLDKTSGLDENLIKSLNSIIMSEYQRFRKAKEPIIRSMTESSKIKSYSSSVKKLVVRSYDGYYTVSFYLKKPRQGEPLFDCKNVSGLYYSSMNSFDSSTLSASFYIENDMLCSAITSDETFFCTVYWRSNS